MSFRDLKPHLRNLGVIMGTWVFYAIACLIPVVLAALGIWLGMALGSSTIKMMNGVKIIMLFVFVVLMFVELFVIPRAATQLRYTGASAADMYKFLVIVISSVTGTVLFGSEAMWMFGNAIGRRNVSSKKSAVSQQNGGAPGEISLIKE